LTLKNRKGEITLIKSVFVINEHGSCIYERHYSKLEDVDSQIFSGFITALGSFALEAMGEDLQALQMAGNQQMVIRRHGVVPIIGVFIADRRDNLTLLNNLLQVILIEFYHSFPKINDPQIKSITDKDEDFKKFLDKTIKSKVSDRSLWFLGPAAGLVLAVLAVFFIYQTTIGVLGGIQTLSHISIPGFIIDLTDGIDPTEFINIQTLVACGIGAIMVMLSTSFLLPGFVSGVISGSRRKGLWGSLLIVIVTFVITLIIENVNIFPSYQLNIFVFFVLMLPFEVVSIILTGYFGGYFAERRRLWPLPHEELPEKIASQISIFFDKLSAAIEDRSEPTYEETYDDGDY